MKKYSLLTGLVICCGLGPVQSASYAEQGQSAAQLEAIAKPDLSACTTGSDGVPTSKVENDGINPARVIHPANRRAFPKGRIAKTLNGIWKGEVAGDAGDVHVDYFWIIDTNLNEALIVAQRSGRETLANAKPLRNAPKLTYLMCAHDGYSPGTNVPQVHQFTKVSDTTDGAAQIVQEATGVTTDVARPTPTDLWRALLAARYFDGLPYVAFAGALFKPMHYDFVKGDNGPPELSLGWDAEYRGGGSTLLKYTTGIPTMGSEQAQFVGTTSVSGDYLVASPGNGNLWKVEAYPKRRTSSGQLQPAADSTIIEGDDYSLAFDAVTLGPLE
jgi:hypothetical protein